MSADLCRNSRCEVLVLHKLLLFLPTYEGARQCCKSSQRFNGILWSEALRLALYNRGSLLTSAISRLLN